MFIKQDVFKEDSQGERKINFKHRRNLNEKVKLEVGKAGVKSNRSVLSKGNR